MSTTQTVQNSVLLAAGPALQSLAAQRMPVRVALKVQRALHAVADAAEPLQAVRRGLIEEHGDGQQISPGDSGWADFVEAFNELAEDSTSVEIPAPVTLSDLGEVEMTPSEVDVLSQVGVLDLDD